MVLLSCVCPNIEQQVDKQPDRRRVALTLNCICGEQVRDCTFRKFLLLEDNTHDHDLFEAFHQGLEAANTLHTIRFGQPI